MPREHANASSDASETISPAAVDDNFPVEEPKVNTADDDLAKEKPQVENATGKVSEFESASDSEHEKKSVRGRKPKMVETKSAQDKQSATEHSEDPVIPAPVRGRRGRKTEATAPPVVRQTTRSRNGKTTEGIGVEVAMEKRASLSSKIALEPKRGRNLKKASDVQVEMAQEVPNEAEREQSPLVDVNQEVNNNAAPLENAVVKPKRGRKAKQLDQLVPEQLDVPCTRSDDLLQTDKAKGLSFPFCVTGLNRNRQQFLVSSNKTQDV